MTQVLNRKNVLFGLAALAISAGLVVGPALQEANAAETIVADAGRIGEGQGQTSLTPKVRRRLSGTKQLCLRHMHRVYESLRISHKHCHDMRVKQHRRRQPKSP